MLLNWFNSLLLLVLLDWKIIRFFLLLSRFYSIPFDVSSIQFDTHVFFIFLEKKKTLNEKLRASFRRYQRNGWCLFGDSMRMRIFLHTIFVFLLFLLLNTVKLWIACDFEFIYFFHFHFSGSFHFYIFGFFSP